MSRSIVIGDVHGCYYTLLTLLDKIDFDDSTDSLYFLGDLVGKGLYSAKVMDFMLTMKHVKVVLGNNDLYWMQYFYTGSKQREDFSEMDRYDNKGSWFAFLKKQTFMIEKDFGVLVHASVDPSWTISDAISFNQEMTNAMSIDAEKFLSNLATKKQNMNKELARIAHGFLIFTQCRYYKDDQVYLDAVGAPEENTNLIPWYSMSRNINKPIIFGHWASLKGRRLPGGVINLDGGAVYGGKLMALIGETGERFSVTRDHNDQ